MKNIKNIIFIVALCIVAYLQIQVSQDTDLISMYNGVIFNGNITFYIRCFFLFACYSLYIYNEFETYMKEYGVLLVTREKSRNRLLMRLTERLLRLIVQIESIKILCYVVFMIIIKGKITANNPFQLIKIVILNILVIFLIMFVQMIVELYFSGNIAVCISLAYFLFSLDISDYIERSNSFSPQINLLMIPNLMMKVRLDMLIKDTGMYFVVMGVLILIVISIYLLTKRQFLNKDII